MQINVQPIRIAIYAARGWLSFAAPRRGGEPGPDSADETCVPAGTRRPDGEPDNALCLRAITIITILWTQATRTAITISTHVIARASNGRSINQFVYSEASMICS
jgi:hypothetical protein